MKSIYILLTRSNTCISKAIKLATNDTYTHVSISFHKNLQPMYSFARKYSLSPLPAGLRMESFTEGFYRKCNDIPCALYELEVEDEVYEAAKNAVETMYAESSVYRYNILGLILCRLNIPFHRERHYFCSEFVSEILKEHHAVNLPKDPSLMRPNDYLDMPLFSCIFEGYLRNLEPYCNAAKQTNTYKLANL